MEIPAQNLEVDRAFIRSSIKLQIPVEITSFTMPHNMEIYTQQVLDVFLEECHQEHLKEYLNYCLNELLTNAKKANTKRVYFKEKNLDINNPNDYEIGMENFKNDTLNDIGHYLELQKKEGLYLKLRLLLRGDQVFIEIINNSVLTTFENERIQEKISLARQYNNMDEIITKILDTTEGAGLGIIIIILMLKKVGLSKDNYQVFSNEKETTTRIILPCNKTISAGIEIMAYEFISLQDQIPVLKTHFCEASHYLSSCYGIETRKKLLNCIKSDISLALLLLSYSVEKNPECISLPKSINLFSDEELKHIFSTENKDGTLVEENDSLTRLTIHTQYTAFFAYNLFKNKSDLHGFCDAESVYTLGLLNSIGFLFLETASDVQKEHVTELAEQYGDISEKILDMFRDGNITNYLKLMYSKKIGFADEITTTLSKWNERDSLSEEILPIVNVLYLAEMMQYYNEKLVNFYQIDKEVLNEFNIHDENQFKSIINKMIITFEETKKC